MKFTKQDLLTMLIGLFLFASCKDSNTIGLDLEEGQEIKGTLMDSATVASKTELDDATSGVSLTRHPLGFITDPVFGTSEASLAMAVSIPSNDFKFGTTPTIDSAVLVLPYSTQFYGDTTTSVYTIEVKQLANDISKERKYMTNQSWPVTGSNLGSFSGKIKPNTKFKISDIVAGKADTLKTVVPQIRIKLDNSFIQTNILNKDSATLSRSSKFFESFKGFHVTAKTTGTGGIMFLNYGGTDASLQIYYKRQNATTTTAIDTVAVNFPIGNNTGPVTTTITHVHPTALKDQITNSTNNVTYLQALGGLRNRISFPYLKKFMTDLKAKNNPNTKVIVNKAQLVVDLSSGTDVIPFSAAQRLALYRYDIAGQRANVPDNDNSVQGVYNGDPRALGADGILFGGFFDSVNKRYIFTITAYIQDLLDGKTEDFGTFLAPSSFTEFNINPPVTSAARSVISKHKKNPAAGDKTLKLNIYYTQVN